jgi:hypothetical protein
LADAAPTRIPFFSVPRSQRLLPIVRGSSQ